MTARVKGLAVLGLQVVLVLSVAATYAWERHACPRVWTRATQFDPEQPLRGRYLALTLEVDACGLHQGSAAQSFDWNAAGRVPLAQWQVETTAKGGKLVAGEVNKDRPPSEQTVRLRKGEPCDRARLAGATEFFIAEHAPTPFPLRAGQELWAEVTVPPSGPPRPIQLAVSDGKGFQVLRLR